MVIVITGVSRGLGRALAEWYIAHGHTVAGCARNGQQIFDLRFAHPEPHSFDPVDVTQATKVDLWAERVLGAHGPPDLLINNAGLMNTPAPLWKVPAEEFAKVMAVNINGVTNVIRAFVPAMIAAKKGVIVNLSSGLGPQRLARGGALLPPSGPSRALTKAPGRRTRPPAWRPCPSIPGRSTPTCCASAGPRALRAIPRRTSGPRSRRPSF